MQQIKTLSGDTSPACRKTQLNEGGVQVCRRLSRLGCQHLRVSWESELLAAYLSALGFTDRHQLALVSQKVEDGSPSIYPANQPCSLTHRLLDSISDIFGEMVELHNGWVASGPSKWDKHPHTVAPSRFSARPVCTPSGTGRNLSKGSAFWLPPPQKPLIDPLDLKRLQYKHFAGTIDQQKSQRSAS